MLIRKGIYFICFLIALSVVLIAYIAGPPPGSTCAPGETSCATNGFCHNATPNTGSGFGDIVLDPPGSKYNPGQNYTLMPYCNDSSGMIFGFQIVARHSNGNTAGSVMISDQVKTQKITSGGFEYVSQTTAGAAPMGIHDWMYDWTAPPAGSGKVIFYAAFVAADGDSTSANDLVYTDTLVLNENTSGIDEYSSGKSCAITDVYFNSGFLYMKINNCFSGKISISLYDLSGRICMDRIPERIGNDFYRMDVSSLLCGYYLLTGTPEHGKREVFKIFISD